jgi:hypothetical protein
VTDHTKPEAPEAAPVSPDRLDALSDELPTALGTGGDALRECVQRLDREVRSRYKKDALQQVIARIGTAAASHPNPLSVFNRALECLDTPPVPETVIRGLLLRERAGPPDELLTDALVWSLMPSSGDGKGVREVSVASASLLRLLKRHLGEHFPDLGLTVWNRAGSQTNHAGWCEAWATMARLILTASEEQPRRNRQETANRYAEAICSAGPGPVRALTPFLLFLAGEMGPLSERITGVIRASPLGANLLRQVRELLGASSAVQPPAGSSPQEANAETARTGTEFGGLPESVELAVGALLSGVRSLQDAHNALQKELTTARQERASFESQVAQLSESVDALTGERDRLAAALVKADKDRDSEQRRADALDRTNSELRRELAEAIAVRGALEGDVRAAREDYDRLRNRSAMDMGQLRQHVLDEVHREVLELWQLMARMLEKVIEGEREPRHLASVWNQLDAILAEQLGKAGHPVGGTHS